MAAGMYDPCPRPAEPPRQPDCSGRARAEGQSGFGLIGSRLIQMRLRCHSSKELVLICGQFTCQTVTFSRPDCL